MTPVLTSTAIATDTESPRPFPSLCAPLVLWTRWGAALFIDYFIIF